MILVGLRLDQFISERSACDQFISEECQCARSTGVELVCAAGRGKRCWVWRLERDLCARVRACACVRVCLRLEVE